MKMKRKMHTLGLVRQRGVTLIELLVASTVSIIAVAGMLAVMAGTLGSGTHTIQMSKMTEELRTTMQIMSRELRRANYHADYLNCYGDFGCLENIPDLGDISGKIGAIGVYESVDSEGGEADCIWFWYERPGSGSVNASTVAGFRRKVDGSGIGRIQMTTGLSSVPTANCGTDSQWTNANGTDITDPDFIDVLSFNVVNNSPAPEFINGSNDIQTVQRIGLTITAKLRAKASVKDFVKDNANATRTLTEFIHVRNNFTTDV
jgi:hypothetical protein